MIRLIEVRIDGTLIKSDGRKLNAVYYVMKLAELGELYNVIDLTPAFSENLARYYFRQLLAGKHFKPFAFVCIFAQKFHVQKYKAR